MSSLRKKYEPKINIMKMNLILELAGYEIIQLIKWKNVFVFIHGQDKYKKQFSSLFPLKFQRLTCCL